MAKINTKGERTRKFDTLLALTTSMPVLAFSLMAVPASAQVATAGEATQVQPAPQETPVTTDADEAEIVVTGIRASIARGAEIKRQSNQVVDAISAEELGKLPDQNIAEGLQRITGVQIQRSGGEGNRFQIRGSDQTLTLVNGREVAPDTSISLTAPQPSRQVSLFNYPSELFSEVLVFKSPSASQVEGGVGGTVDLRMPDPLKSSERTVLAADVGYLSLAEKVGYRGTALISRRFADDTIGVILGATYFKRDTVTDRFEGGSYFLSNAVDVTGDGVADPRVALPFNQAYNRQFNYRDRLSLNALVAWEPSEAFKAYVDLTYIKQSTAFQLNFLGFNFSNARTPTTPTAFVTQQEADGSTTVLAGTFRNVLNSQDGREQSEDRELYDGAVGMVWRPSDRLTLSGEVAVSKSKVDSFLNIFQVSQPSVVTSIDLRSEVPGAAIVTGGALDDASAYRAFVTNTRSIENNPEVLQGRLDAAYTFEDSFLSKLSVGGRITRQTFDNIVLQNRFQNTFPIGANPPLTAFPQYTQVFQGNNFFAGAAGDYPTRFVRPVVPGTAEAGRELLTFLGDTRPLQPLPVSNFEITEKTYAAYAQLDFGAEVFSLPFAGNVGVRYVKTDLTSASSALTPAGVVVPISFENSYTDVLPSFNGKLELADGFVVRVSAAKVISRPPIISLSAGTNIQLASGLNSAQSGQPLLEPFRATQYDVSAEYYFPGGGLISGALFYKDIKSFITQTSVVGATLPGFPGQTFFLTQPTNGPGGSSKGFEFGFQKSFGFISQSLDGFGIIANYTYVDSQRDDSDLPLEGTSKHSYNVIGFYEQGPFQARVAYNWRDEQYNGLNRAANIFSEARGQVDFSMSYDLRKNITVTLEGVDLLQTPQRGYAEFESRTNLYEISDRRIFAGLRVRL